MIETRQIKKEVSTQQLITSYRMTECRENRTNGNRKHIKNNKRRVITEGKRAVTFRFFYVYQERKITE